MQETAKALPDGKGEYEWLVAIVTTAIKTVWRMFWGDKEDKPTVDELLQMIGTIVLKLLELRKNGHHLEDAPPSS